MKHRIVILVIFLFTCFSVAYSQIYDVSRYADDNGLPSRIVRDVIQDQEGFLWVAGNNGLYKFDGQKFHPYYSSLKDSTGLRDNKITAILSASDKRLWIGTPKGLHVMEGGTIKYFTLSKAQKENQKYIRSLMEDDNGNIWVGTYEGLFVIDKEKAQAYLLSDLEIGDIPKQPISGLVKNKNNRIWISTNKNRVFVSTKESLFKFNEVALTFDNELKNERIILFRIIDYNDNLMLAESNVGLLKVITQDDTHIQLSYFKDKDSLPVAQEYVYKAIVDHNRDIWVATWKNRFKKYSLDNEQLVEQHVIGSQGNYLSMSDNAISVYEDQQQNIWIPNTNGLYKLSLTDNTISKFPPSYLPDCIAEGLSIYAITEDDGGHLWITTPYNLYRFKKSDLTNGRCPTDYLHIKNENLRLSRYVLIDSKNRLWLGAEHGLSVTQLDENFNPGKFTRFTTNHGLPHNWCQAIYEEDEDNFWIGNYAGLVKLTIDNQDFENSTFKVYSSDPKDDNTLVNSYTMEIVDDKNDNIWIGTFFGLSKMISEDNEGKFSNYLSNTKDFESLSNDAIKRLYRDSLGRLWIGTQTGLNLYNDKKDTFIQLGRNEGLPSEYILGIDEDSQGFLWIATTNGVIKATYDIENKTFTNITHYTKKDGLADNITYRNAMHIDNNDSVFIGSRNGLSIISNERQTTTYQSFNIAITSVQSTNKNTSGFNSIIMDKYDKPITLSHQENSIKINYAVLDLTSPELNRYRHKILPLNDQWIETEHNSDIAYYNLNPGDYKIILDGSNNEDAWSDNPIS
ncbi:MAG: two-component regulator propeller domain-containing protein, partial [Bacteroidota bacterium]